MSGVVDDTKKPRCKEVIRKTWDGHRCTRPAWKDGYCRQHHPDAVAARREKSRANDQRRWEESPHHKLELAKEKITKLESEIERLKSQIETLNGGI